MTQIRTTTQETREVTTIESLTVAPGVDVQRITVVRQTGDQQTKMVSEKVVHQIATTDENFGNFCVVEPALPEQLRTKGWLVDDKDMDLVSKKPFTRALDGKPYLVVRFKHWDHSLFDHEGQRLPVAKQFNYLDGRVSDYNFDLKGLLKHLQGRDDVTLHKERYSDRMIHPIPSYNAGGTTGDYGLEFTWHPDVTTFRQYCELAEKLDSFAARPNVALTLMGCDEFRIEHPDEESDDSESDD